MCRSTLGVKLRAEKGSMGLAWIHQVLGIFVRLTNQIQRLTKESPALTSWGDLEKLITGITNVTTEMLACA